MRYEDASHTGAFQGQGPVANDDLEMVAAGSKSAATGNLITGDGTQSGSAGADSAAGAHITAIAGKSGEDTSFAGGKLSVEGEYGKLSVDAEGNYVYQANKGVENVRDRFTYTLADNQGATDSAALIVEIGKTPVVIKADAQQIVPGPDGVVTLPPGVELSDVHVVGRNLVIDMPDGTQLIIIDGAVFVPQLVVNGVEVPATNVAALLVGQEIQPAAGELPPSSGGNFAVPPPPLDPGVPLGDLIPPTEYTYQPPEPQPPLDIQDTEPEAGVANAILDDDAQAGGIAGGVGDDPGTNFASGNLSGSGGDGSLEWALLASGTLPAGFSFSLQGNGDLWVMQGATHVLTITVNSATGDYTVTQVAAIDHPAGGDENNLDFVINYSVTDDDGDTAVGTLTVNVDDDTPTVDVTVASDANVVLLTHDAATDGDPTDTDTDSTTADFGGIFLHSSAFGADGAGTANFSYALSTIGGASGLSQHGTAINLYLIGGVVVGSTAATVGAVNAGNTVFDISVDANTGVVTVNQYSQIDHTNTDPSPTGPGYEDHLISLADGAVTLTQTGTVTDGDGDTVTDSASVGIGGNIHFADDGPSIDPTLNEVGAAIVDESEPVDAATIPLVAGFTRGDDPDLSGGLAIGKGSTSGPVIDANAVFGADGPANGGGISYDLVVGNTVSGLTTTEGVAINLVELSNGVVVGVVDGTTTVAFAISIDSSTGVVTVEQYLSIFHPDSPNNFDEPVFLDEGSLGVTVTASDFDGDSVTSDAVDITSLIRFEDDGPSVSAELSTDAPAILDESPPVAAATIDTGPYAKGDDPDLVGGQAIGSASTTLVVPDADFGADGPADSNSLTYELTIIDSSSGLTTTDGSAIDLVLLPSGVVVGVVNGGPFDGQAAFAISIDTSTGVIFAELYLSLDHPDVTDPNDLLTLAGGTLGAIVTATDGDGDIATSGVIDVGSRIQFFDDGPASNDDSDTVNNDTDTAVGNVITGSGTTEGTGNADVPGADGFGSITGLVSDETDDSDTDSSGGFTVTGLYGTLQMDADGNYTYTRDPASPGNVSESFTYTYVDGDGDPITAVLTININDETPTLPDPDLIRLDDDVIPGKNGNDPDGPGDDNPDGIGNNVVNGQLNGSGGNGTLTYNFTGDNTLPADFSIGAGSDSDTLIIVQDQNGSLVTVMTIQLDQSDGSFTVTQNNPVWHPADTGGPDDNIENNLVVQVGVEVEDADGDTEPATITINVDDDTPTINVTAGSDSGVNLTTDDADTIGVATDTASSSANFGGVFGLAQSAGADGTNAAATLLYTLDVTGYAGGPAGVNSGLESHNADIFLYEIGGKVVGSTSATLAGVTGGNTIFDVSVAGDGTVTLTQYQQIDHDTADPTPTGSPFADHIVSLTDSLVTLTASASLTDKDGDTVTDSETVNIGANLHFTDDGPDAQTSGTGVGTVTLDETRGEGTDTVGGSAPTGDASATIDFSVNFVTGGSVDYGADGAGSVTYALHLTGSNVNSGLYALDNTDTTLADLDGYGQGGQIVLNQVGNTITGSYNGTNYFTITIDPATGVVTFTQLNNIWHPTAGSSAAALDESATLNTLAANLIQVVQTVTDFDGDTDTASINIGQGVFIIQDDGPRFGPDIDATLSILNDANPSNTGDLDIVIGTDSPNGPLVGANPAQTQDDISVSNFTVQVNGVDADNIVLTPGAENASTASYTFSFDYDTGTGGTATAEGTLVFDKSAGTYTVTLTNGPIEGFSLLSTGAADASDFVSYQVPNGGSGSPEVTVAQLDTDFFVQFSSVAEPGSGTGTDNLTTTQGAGGTFNPTTGSFAGLELFSQTMSTVQVSSTAAGVAGNTIQGGEVLDLNLYSSDPAGTLGGVPTQSSTSMFMVLDGIGTSEDMIVVLKLLDTSTGQYTTKAIIVQNGDILTDADAASLAGTAYEGLGAALDNNDGLIVIEANDYQEGNTNLVIVGAQIAGSDEGIIGTGINLNGEVGDSGGSSGTQAFSTDASDAPFKITSIGFLTTTTEDQTASIDFDVTIHDADGDTATQHITVDIGDTQSPALLPPAPESFSTTLSSESLLASDSHDVQKHAANSNTLTMAAAVAAAGMTESVAAAPASDDQSSVNSDLQVQSTQTVEKVVAADGNDDSSSVAGLPETQEADTAPGNSGGHSQADGHRADASLDAASNQQSSDHGSEQQAANDDQGPAAASADASPAAQSVAMVSAEALQAAGLDGNAQHGGAVEKIIAEALGHGNGGGAVDALLDAIHGGHGGGQAIANLASSPAGGVSAWDMASNGGSAGGSEMLMKVGAEMLHHDMVQPTHNG